MDDEDLVCFQQEGALYSEDELDVDEARYYYPSQHHEAAYEEEGLPSPPTERQKEYLRLLQERNRALKQIGTKSRSELEQERREKGFDTHFRGANEGRFKKVDAQAAAGRGRGRSSSTLLRKKLPTPKAAPSSSSGLRRTGRSEGSHHLSSCLDNKRGSDRRRSPEKQQEKREGRQEGGGRRRWSKDKPLDFIKAEDGQIVPVGRGGTRQSPEKRQQADDDSTGRDDYEDDFDDEEGEEYDEHASTAAANPIRQEVMWEQDEGEDEEFSLDESGVLRAIVHQASHGVADIRGTCSHPGAASSMTNQSTGPSAPVPYYPWDGDDGAAESDSDSSIISDVVDGTQRQRTASDDEVEEIGEGIVHQEGRFYSEGEDELYQSSGQIKVQDDSHSSQEEGGGRRALSILSRPLGPIQTPSRQRRSPLIHQKTIKPLAVTKLAGQGYKSGVTHDKEMREVLAALELENKNTPRAGWSCEKRPSSAQRTKEEDDPPKLPTSSVAPVSDSTEEDVQGPTAEKWNDALTGEEENSTPRDIVVVGNIEEAMRISHGSTGDSAYQELLLRIYTTWSGTRVVGLEQIDVVNNDDTKIILGKENLMCRLGPVKTPVSVTDKMAQNLEKLVDGKIGSGSDMHMWVGRIESDCPLDICIRLQKDETAKSIKIWNYRRGPNITKIGAKDVDILLNDRCLWSGIINEGVPGEHGNESSSTEILLTPQKQTKEQQPEVVSKDQEPIWLAERPSRTLSSPSPAVLEDNNVPSKRPLLSSGRRKSDPPGRRSQDHDIKPKSSKANQATAVSPRASIPTSNPQQRRVGDEGYGTQARTEESSSSSSSSLSSLQKSWESLALFEKLNEGRIGVGRSVVKEPVYDAHHIAPSPGMVEAIGISPATVLKQPQLAKDERVAFESVASTNSYDDLLADLCHEVVEDSNDNISSQGIAVNKSVSLDGLPVDSMESSLINMPILPKGQKLHLLLLSTWGDPHYVALSGIEMFDEYGQVISIKDAAKQVTSTAAPFIGADDGANIASWCTPDKLFDGVNFTQDDLHVWLASFEKGKDNRIEIDLGRERTLSMVRIWNYNQSRPRSHRGVRRVRLLLDDKAIFEGDIGRAPGLLEEPEQCHEIILFTFDHHILKAIEDYDRKEGYLKVCNQQDKNQQHAAIVHRQGSLTSEGFGSLDLDQVMKDVEDGRVIGQRTPRPDDTIERIEGGSLSTIVMKRSSMINLARSKTIDEKSLLYGRRLAVHLERNWGDSQYIGLGGLQVLVGSDLKLFPLRPDQINAVPVRDLKTMGYTEDRRVIDNLIKRPLERTGSCHTTSKEKEEDEMDWLIPLPKASTSSACPRPVIKIDLGVEQPIAALAVWNYNRPGSNEEDLRGVKCLSVTVDGTHIASFNVRKGPGLPGLDHLQILYLNNHDEDNQRSKGEKQQHQGVQSHKYVTYITPSVRQDYETLLHPTGLLLSITLENGWGCPYYLGLDGIQLLGGNGKEITAEPSRIQAWPSHVGNLSGAGEDDCRVPGNLFDQVLASKDASHSWLAPFAGASASSSSTSSPPGENVLFIFFDDPVIISAIRFFNYRKTPSRGVRDISICLDGRLLYRGTIKQAPALSETSYDGQVVLFTNDQVSIRREKSRIAYCGAEEQDVLCVDDRQVRIRSRYSLEAPDPSAVGVRERIDLSSRPLTSVEPKKGMK